MTQKYQKGNINTRNKGAGSFLAKKIHGDMLAAKKEVVVQIFLSVGMDYYHERNEMERYWWVGVLLEGWNMTNIMGRK